MANSRYQVQVGDATYEVTAPDERTAWQWANMTHQNSTQTATARPKSEQTFERSPLQDIPVVGEAVSGLADIPLSFGQGVTNIGKTLSDMFGAGNAASGKLGEISSALEKWKSAESKRDSAAMAKVQKEAEGKGIWEEVEAALKAFSYSPLETTAGVAGSIVPFAAAAAATAPLGAAAALTSAGALGAGSGAGMIKGSIYDAVLDEGVAAGMSEAKAKALAEKAQEYGGKNMDQIALGGALGALAAATGVAPAAARAIGNRAAARVVDDTAKKKAAQEALEKTASRGTAAAIARGAAAEAVPEAVQGGQERLAQNLALAREGYDVDPMQGVVGQGAFEGIASLLLGGGAGMSERSSARRALEEQQAQPAQQAQPGPAPEVIAAFDTAFTQAVVETMAANPGMTQGEAVKRTLPRAAEIFAGVEAGVEEAEVQAQAEPGAGAAVSETGGAPSGATASGVGAETGLDAESVAPAGAAPLDGAPLAPDGPDGAADAVEPALAGEPAPVPPIESLSPPDPSGLGLPLFPDLVGTAPPPQVAPAEPAPAPTPLRVTKGTQLRRSPFDGAQHVVELSDGSTVFLYRDTDQFGASNPQWYVEDPVSGYSSKDVTESLGGTKKEALERVAGRVERERARKAQETPLDGTQTPAPAPEELVAEEAETEVGPTQEPQEAPDEGEAPALTPDGVLAKAQEAAGMGALTPGMLARVQELVNTEGMPLEQITSEIDRLVTNFTLGRVGETPVAAPPTEVGFAPEAAPDETVEEDTDDLLAPARGLKTPKERQAALAPVVDMLVGGSTTGVKVPVGMTGKKLQDLKSKMARALAVRATKSEPTDVGAYVDDELRKAGFDIPQAAPVVEPVRAPKGRGAVAAAASRGVPAVIPVNIATKPNRDALNNLFRRRKRAPEGETSVGAGADLFGDLTPQKEDIRARPGVNLKRLTKMLGPQLYGDYAEMASVTVKETLQNSFDAIKAVMAREPGFRGFIEIEANRRERTITVTDNGSGMSPQLLAGKFLEIAGTEKEATEASGGFGIAKALFLYENNGLMVRTLKDGVVSVLNTTGAQLKEAMEVESAGVVVTTSVPTADDFYTFPAGHGTKIIITIPDDYEDPTTGRREIIFFNNHTSRYTGLVKSPLFADIDVVFNGDRVPIGANFPADEFSPFTKVKFNWGTADIYVSKHKPHVQTNNVNFLSNGVWQFGSKLTASGNSWEPLPYEFYIDVHPTAKPEDPGYPFALNRQRMTDIAAKEMKTILGYVQRLYAVQNLSDGAQTYGTIQYYDKEGGLGEPVDLTPGVPKIDTAYRGIRKGDKVTVDKGRLLVNGEELPALTPEDLAADIPAPDKLVMDPALIDTDRVMLHENVEVEDTNARRPPIPLTIFMREKFGDRFDEMNFLVGETFVWLRNAVAEFPGYDALMQEAIGVSFDKSYRGVSIKVPFSGMFINPLVPESDFSPEERGYGILGTMLHELAHFKERSHGAAFPAEMQRIMYRLQASKEVDYDTMSKWFVSQLATYDDIITYGQQLEKGAIDGVYTSTTGSRFDDGAWERVSSEGRTGVPEGDEGYEPSRQRVRGGTGRTNRPAGRGSAVGAGVGTGPSSAQPQPIRLTQSQLNRARTRAGIIQAKNNRAQRRVAQTNDVADLMGQSLELTKLWRRDPSNLAIAKAAGDTLSIKGLRAFLPAMDTQDIFRMLGDRIPALKRVDDIIRKGVTQLEAREYRRLAGEAEGAAKFFRNNPKAVRVFSDVQFVMRMYQVDPTKAANAGEYILKVDRRLADIRTALKAETDPKKIAALKAQQTARQKAIRAVYEGGDIDGSYVNGWKDLKTFGPEAIKTLTMMHEAHRRDLEANYQAIRERVIATTPDEETQEERLAKLKAAFAPARGQMVYFPLMRNGDYYLRLGSGANSTFVMFPTEGELNKARRLLEADPKDRPDITESGNIRDLYESLPREEDTLREVLRLFDEDPTKKLTSLREEVFDLWLQNGVVGEMSKHLLRADFRAGYSTNVLKNFLDFRRMSVNNTKRALYGHELDTALSEAKESLTQDMGGLSRDRAMTFVREIDLRARNRLAPSRANDSVFDKAVELGNKAAFYQYLANVKTASIQLTQLHVVSLPLLAQKYGHGRALAALTKHALTSLGGFVVSPLKAAKRSSGGVYFDWQQPSILDSNMVQRTKTSDPQLYDLYTEGWEQGDLHNIFLNTFAQTAAQAGNTDPTQRSVLQEAREGNLGTAGLRASTYVFKAMAGLMHQMERVNREGTYMAALELGYRAARRQGMGHEAAKAKAIEDAITDAVEAAFDFTAYNKPRIFTGGIGRVAGQFFTYPYMLMSLLARNTFKALGAGNLPKAERLAAAELSAGVLMNIGLYAGLVGTPLYSIAKVIGWMVADMFDDDDDEGGLSYIDKETGELKATYDIDWWFRNVWIPKFFGPGGTVAEMFDLSPEMAQIIEQSALKGPISVLSGVDLANSIALDFGFFMPEEPRSETLELQMAETAFNAFGGAAASMLMDYGRMVKDVLDGRTDRMLDKAPKLVAGPAKAVRFGAEGQRGYTGELVGMDKEFWTTDKQLLQALNFAATEADIKSETGYSARKLTRDIEAKRTKVLEKFKFAINRMTVYGENPETEALVERAVEAVDEYNTKYESDPISYGSLNEVASNVREKIGQSEEFEGLPFDTKGKTPYLERMLDRRLMARAREEAAGQ